MAKLYRGGNTVLEPPPEGWGILWFADGYKAQVAGAKIVNKEGKELIRFYLTPFQATIKRFNIDIKLDLDRNGYMYKWYPKEYVYPLNNYDPTRRIFFCMLNWDGKQTESTKWFKGEEQAEEIRKLREQIRGLKAYNEALKEENFILKTNTQKFIKDNIEGIIKPIMPAVRNLITPEVTTMGGQGG